MDSGTYHFSKVSEALPKNSISIEQQIGFITDARKVLQDEPRAVIELDKRHVEMLRQIEESLVAAKLLEP